MRPNVPASSVDATMLLPARCRLCVQAGKRDAVSATRTTYEDATYEDARKAGSSIRQELTACSQSRQVHAYLRRKLTYAPSPAALHRARHSINAKDETGRAPVPGTLSTPRPRRRGLPSHQRGLRGPTLATATPEDLRIARVRDDGARLEVIPIDN